MVRLSLSTDANIRSQVMAQIRAITNSNLLDISEKIKQILCERARDKIVRDLIVFNEHTHSLSLIVMFLLVGSSKRSSRLSWTCLQKRMYQCQLVG